MPKLRVTRGKVLIQMDDDPTHYGDTSFEIPETHRPYKGTATVLATGAPMPTIKKVRGKTTRVDEPPEVSPGDRLVVPDGNFGTTIQSGSTEIRFLTFEQVRQCLRLDT